MAARCCLQGVLRISLLSGRCRLMGTSCSREFHSRTSCLLREGTGIVFDTPQDLPRNMITLRTEPFSEEVRQVLQAPLAEKDIEINSEGMVKLPALYIEKTLNKAFGSGNWQLLPCGRVMKSKSNENMSGVVREFALYVNGDLISQAVGEAHSYNDDSELSEAQLLRLQESALTRCAKDLGVGSELWDRTYQLVWREKYATQVWAVNADTMRKKMVWRKKDRKLPAPWIEQKH